uniref:TonB-dependent receptor n=1 Tax=uncultured Draconibacterium sp. TaxID=1573823 RepID=UPI003217DAA7
MSGKPIQYLFTLCFCVLCILQVVAQQKVTVSGTITDTETKQPVVYANIAFPDLGIGTSSNEKGEFSIKNVPAGPYKLLVSYIGYQEYSLDMTLRKDVNLSIRLKQQSLGLKEVIVTAQNSTSGTTASKIKSDAINHVQATSLKEIMQLIPGNLSKNPNLADAGKISIREINEDVNSALGTAIIVDDIPFSNDGNMQKSIKAGGFTSVAGTGVDIRQISVENIESITVDVGIPSAEHGNLTSGAVHIKTKSGGSPYSVKLQTDPRTKQAYLGKGYLLNNNKGVINIDAGYANSFRYISTQTDHFERINTSTKYSNTFFRGKSPLNIEVKLDYLKSIDEDTWDPDMKAEEEDYSKDQNIKGKISALWSVNKNFFKSLSFDAGYSKTWQEGFEKTLETTSSGANFFSTATEDGEYEIQYGPATYYSEVNYDGRPFSFYSKLKAKFYKKSDIITNNVLLGAEWRTTGNNGEGRTFDVNNPPSGEGTRPRPFTDIPSLNQFSVFAEDKIDLKLGETHLNIMAGIRMDNVHPSGPFSTDGSLNFDPRINIHYDIIKRNSNYTFRNLSLRLGYGQTSKAPTLTHLYPDKEYNDVVSFNYYPDLIVSTTKVLNDTRNYDLKAARSKKYEAGIDFQLGKVKSRVTGFYEKHEGGFILDRNFFLMNYRDYEQLDPDLSPYYEKGKGIFYDDPTTGESVVVPYELDEKYKSYEMYRNAGTREKRGIEYNIDFGKIQAIRTSFLLNGAWLRTETYKTDAPYWVQEYYTTYNNNISTQESFVVKFPNQYGYSVVNSRLNTNLSVITHIPELKMLVTLTTQAVWFEKNWRNIVEKNNLYSLIELRDYLNQSELFSNEKEDDFYYYLPVSYRGYDGVENIYKISDFQESLAQQAIKKDQKYRYSKRTLSPLFLCNIKISKDIAQRFKLSFYANNFLNIRPWELDKRNGKYIRRNETPYFGADIKMLF